jgi:hypothetical protein
MTLPLELVSLTFQIAQESLVFMYPCCRIWQNLPSRPYLATQLPFALMMLPNKVAHSFLDEQRPLLHSCMHLATNVDTCTVVLLRVEAKPLVFVQYPLVHGINGFELRVGGVLVSIDFVLHGAMSG